jgi:Bacterial SH3 domain
MASKARADDWDRLFAPGAPRRGGPLRVFAYTLLTIVTIALLSGAAVYVLRVSERQRAAQIAQATVQAATNGPLQTATTQAAALETATRFAIRTATAVARQTPQPAPAQANLGTRAVTRSGNIRSEPRVAPETVIGQVALGDQLTILEERSIDGETWYRAQISQGAATRPAEAAPVGTVGWVAALLVR